MTSAPTTTLARQAWYRWKTLRLPWRKRFLVGFDLKGNTFWEFRDTLASHKHRMRRIAQYPSNTHHSEVQISPQWHQWLRHTRRDPPSLTEQSQDLVRQQNLKVLAAEADARWSAKPSFLNAPAKASRPPLTATEDAELASLGLSTKPQAELGGQSTIKGSLDEKIQGGGPMKKSSVKQGGENTRRTDLQDEHQVEQGRASRNKKSTQENVKDDPLEQARGGPSEEWQPSSWDGNILPSRR